MEELLLVEGPHTFARLCTNIKKAVAGKQAGNTPTKDKQQMTIKLGVPYSTVDAKQKDSICPAKRSLKASPLRIQGFRLTTTNNLRADRQVAGD